MVNPQNFVIVQIRRETDLFPQRITIAWAIDGARAVLFHQFAPGEETGDDLSPTEAASEIQRSNEEKEDAGGLTFIHDNADLMNSIWAQCKIGKAKAEIYDPRNR